LKGANVDNSTPGSGTATIIASHVPVDLAREIAVVARENDRTMSGEIRHAVRLHVEAFRAARRSTAEQPA
jgi:hypothetical protein